MVQLAEFIPRGNQVLSANIKLRNPPDNLAPESSLLFRTSVGSSREDTVSSTDGVQCRYANASLTPGKDRAIVSGSITGANDPDERVRSVEILNSILFKDVMNVCFQCVDHKIKPEVSKLSLLRNPKNKQSTLSGNDFSLQHLATHEESGSDTRAGQHIDQLLSSLFLPGDVPTLSIKERALSFTGFDDVQLQWQRAYHAVSTAEGANAKRQAWLHVNRTQFARKLTTVLISFLLMAFMVNSINQWMITPPSFDLSEGLIRLNKAGPGTPNFPEDLARLSKNVKVCVSASSTHVDPGTGNPLERGAYTQARLELGIACLKVCQSLSGLCSSEEALDTILIDERRLQFLLQDDELGLSMLQQVKKCNSWILKSPEGTRELSEALSDCLSMRWPGAENECPDWLSEQLVPALRRHWALKLFSNHRTIAFKSKGGSPERLAAVSELKQLALNFDCDRAGILISKLALIEAMSSKADLKELFSEFPELKEVVLGRPGQDTQLASGFGANLLELQQSSLNDIGAANSASFLGGQCERTLLDINFNFKPVLEERIEKLLESELVQFNEKLKLGLAQRKVAALPHLQWPTEWTEPFAECQSILKRVEHSRFAIRADVKTRKKLLQQAIRKQQALTLVLSFDGLPHPWNEAVLKRFLLQSKELQELSVKTRCEVVAFLLSLLQAKNAPRTPGKAKSPVIRSMHEVFLVAHPAIESFGEMIKVCSRAFPAFKQTHFRKYLFQHWVKRLNSLQRPNLDESESFLLSTPDDLKTAAIKVIEDRYANRNSPLKRLVTSLIQEVGFKETAKEERRFPRSHQWALSVIFETLPELGFVAEVAPVQGSFDPPSAGGRTFLFSPLCVPSNVASKQGKKDSKGKASARGIETTWARLNGPAIKSVIKFLGPVKAAGKKQASMRKLAFAFEILSYIGVLDHAHDNEGLPGYYKALSQAFGSHCNGHVDSRLKAVKVGNRSISNLRQSPASSLLRLHKDAAATLVVMKTIDAYSNLAFVSDMRAQLKPLVESLAKLSPSYARKILLLKLVTVLANFKDLESDASQFAAIKLLIPEHLSAEPFLEKIARELAEEDAFSSALLDPIHTDYKVGQGRKGRRPEVTVEHAKIHGRDRTCPACWSSKLSQARLSHAMKLRNKGNFETNKTRRMTGFSIPKTDQ